MGLRAGLGTGAVHQTRVRTASIMHSACTAASLPCTADTGGLLNK